MPLLALACPNGHQRERFVHVFADRYRLETLICAECGHPYVEQPGYAIPLLYFSEKRPRHIVNLGATIRSHGEHVRVMKERGVEPSTDWWVSRKMSDGLKTKATPPHARHQIKEHA